jgi:hypothetical protein
MGNTCFHLMGNSWRARFDAASAVVNAIVSFIEPAQVDRAKEHIPGIRG